MHVAVDATAKPTRHPASAPVQIRTLAELPGLVLRHQDGRAVLRQCSASGVSDLSASAFAEQVRHIGLALLDMGIEPGDRIAIMSETRQAWLLADLGIITARGVTVPVYPTLPAPQARFVLHDAGARGVFVSNAEQAAKVLSVRHLLPELEFIVVFDGDASGGASRPASIAAEHATVLPLTHLLERGAAVAATQPDAVTRYDAGIRAVQPEHLLTIIYTSGTTGEPKGVMLTHDNLLSNVRAAVSALQLRRSDVALSFLPLSHVFERMVSFLYLHEGVQLCHAESLDTIARDLQVVKPTVMTGVPRVYEKLYARIHDAVAAGPAFRRRLFTWAVGVGTEVASRRQQGQTLSPLLRIKESVTDGLVASKVRARVGGRLRLAVSGSAPLPAYLAEFFAALGLPLIEGYGLTETSPAITVNPVDRPRPGTVGIALDGAELTIAEDGEILTRGPHIMRGYWQRPEETAAVIDADGWFHTGDIGTLSDDGYLTITDRKKELLVTSGGKKIAPAPIEALLKRHPLVAEAMLVGEARRFPAVLIVPDFAALEQRLKVLGLPSDSREVLVTRPDVLSLYQEVIEPLNRDLAQFERIKKVALLPVEFSVSGGELTPTLKLRRRVVAEKWRTTIDSLYEEA